MNRVVDFYKAPEVLGGVQSIFSQLSEILPNTRPLSFRDVAIASDVPTNPMEYHFFELEAGYIMDAYLKMYERVSRPDFIIRNSIMGTFHKPKTSQVCVIQDNNISGPNILHRKGMYHIISYLKFRKSYLYMQKTTIENSDVCVAVSKNIADDYEKELGIKAEVIHNGIDTKLFRPMDKEKLREKYGLPKDRIIGISVQKYHPIKGWHVIAELIKNYPDVFWIIVFTQELNHSRVMAKNVKIFYKMGSREMAELYNTADFSLQPSACESFNLCTAEAMSCGVPAIVSNTGFISDLGKTGLTDYGFVADEWDNVNKYAEAIYVVLEKENLNPREIILSKFSKEIWEQKWKKLIKKL